VHKVGGAMEWYAVVLHQGWLWCLVHKPLVLVLICPATERVRLCLRISVTSKYVTSPRPWRHHKWTILDVLHSPQPDPEVGCNFRNQASAWDNPYAPAEILVAVSAFALASSTCASRAGKTEMGRGPWADQRGGSFEMFRSQCSISGLDHSVETLQTHGEAHHYTGCFTHVKDI